MLRLNHIVSFICILTISAQSFGQNLFMPNNIKYKKFNNGFSYYLIPEGARGKVGMYLVSNTGSLVENPQERGVGHFLEHMVFKGSKNYPGDETAELFDKMGLRVGRDYNASVDNLKTEYEIFIPEGNLDNLHQTLLLFKDWISDLQMQNEAFKVEQKVVIEEISKRSTVSSPFLKGTPLEGHNGLGTKEQINNITINQVRDFYKKNYSTNQLCLVIQGKIDENEVEKQLEAIFGVIKTPKNTNTSKYLDLSKSTVIDGSFKRFNEKELPSLMLAFKAHSVPVDSYESFKQNIIQSLFCEMMENRLTKFSGQSVAKSEVSKGTIVTGTMMYNFKIKSRSETSYPQMITDFCTVVAQARKFGFLQEELNFFKANLISKYKNTSQNDNVSLSDVKNHFLEGDVPLSGKARFEIGQQIITKLKPDDFKELLNTFTDYHKTILFDKSSAAFQDTFTDSYILNKIKNIDKETANLTAFQFEKSNANFSVRGKTENIAVTISEKSPVKIKERIELGEKLYLLKFDNGASVVINVAPDADTQIKIVGKEDLNAISKEDSEIFESLLKTFDESFGTYSDSEANSLLRKLRILKSTALSQNNYEFQLKGESESFTQLIQIFNLLLTEAHLPNKEAVAKKLKENKEVSADLINRMFDYNQKLKLNFSNSYVYVGGNLPANIDELVAQYIGTIKPLESNSLKVNNSEISNEPESKAIYKINPKTAKLKMPEFVFSANMQRKLTFKDKLITDAVAEYGYKQMFQVLRKKYGLVYSTGSSAFNDVENNTASISIRYIADETNLSKCHDIMIAEVFTPMSKAELSDSDVAVVKAMIENKYKLSFYDEDRLSNDYLKWALDYRKLFSIKDFQDEISKISAEEVRQFMKKLIILKEGL